MGSFYSWRQRKGNPGHFRPFKRGFPAYTSGWQKCWEMRTSFSPLLQGWYLFKPSLGPQTTPQDSTSSTECTGRWFLLSLTMTLPARQREGKITVRIEKKKSFISIIIEDPFDFLFASIIQLFCFLSLQRQAAYLLSILILVVCHLRKMHFPLVQCVYVLLYLCCVYFPGPWFITRRIHSSMEKCSIFPQTKHPLVLSSYHKSHS